MIAVDWRRTTKRVLSLLFFAVFVLMLSGCLDDAPTDVVRLQASAGAHLAITIDDKGWHVASAGREGVYVTEQIIVETDNPTLVIVWRNDDDRFHEIMFHQDHSDHDAVRLNPGELVEQIVDVGFERYIHSHHAPDMPELLIRIVGE